MLIFLDLPEDRSRVRFGQVEIEEYETWPGSFLKWSDSPEKGKRLLAVRSDTYVHRWIQASKGLSDKPHIARIILHN